MTAVDLLMADGTVLIARRAEIVKCRRHHADCTSGTGKLLWQIGMTFQADEAHVGARQHLRIRGPVKFVTRLASLGSDGRMFISEGSAKVRVTRKARGLVCRECANLPRQKAAMRIVTIHAGHGTLRKTVRIASLERRPDV